jgi:hypothetical protein
MEQIRIGVYRMDLNVPVPEIILKNHKLRRDALHDAFDNDEAEVTDWGLTNDDNPHEYVEIILSIAGPALARHVVLPAVRMLFEKIAEKAVDTFAEKAVSWIIAKLKPTYEKKQIAETIVMLPDGNNCRLIGGENGIELIYSNPSGTYNVTIPKG